MSSFVFRVVLGGLAFSAVSYWSFRLLNESGPLSTAAASRTVLFLSSMAAIAAINNPGSPALSLPYMTIVFQIFFSSAILLAVMLTDEPALAILVAFSTLYASAVNQRTNPGLPLFSAVLFALAVSLYYTDTGDLSSLVDRYRDAFKGRVPDDAVTGSYLTGDHTVFVLPPVLGAGFGIFAFAVLYHGAYVHRKYFGPGDPDLRILLDPEGEGPENLHRFLS